ncbi:MAG: histidinol dehydrogenase [Euryarchaeota archaeon]|nr:histidinol dehydrogenase [Euryarchaeota archaeon]
MLFTELKNLSREQREKLLNRRRSYEEAEAGVRQILERVRRHGDRALVELTREFDGVELESISVPEEVLEEAQSRLSREVLEALETARSCIADFHRRQLPKDWSYTREGATLGMLHRPLESVGCYVPGGRASYPSTVLMCAVPARLAGVERVAVCTPPGKNGYPEPLTLAACRLAGVREVYSIGGAQAVAALAYGTESVRRVEKIVGPGNVYVTIAKRLVSGEVATDMPAGPSEVLILADASAEAEIVALDMLAQAEHDPMAVSVLVTTSRELAEKVVEELESARRSAPEAAREAIEAGGAVLIAESMEEAVRFANEFAPEHLQVLTEEEEQVLQRVKNAGSVFLGRCSPVACGDYASGTNHVLPTSGYARAYSGLSVYDFMKRITYQKLSMEGLERIAKAAITLARAEGLEMHARSIEARLERRYHD